MIFDHKAAPNLVNVIVGVTWVSGLATAWFLSDHHPYLAFASLFLSFTARLELPALTTPKKDEP